MKANLLFFSSETPVMITVTIKSTYVMGDRQQSSYYFCTHSFSLSTHFLHLYVRFWLLFA